MSTKRRCCSKRAWRDTTYSALSYETLRLVLDGALFFAVANVLISIVATVGAAFLGAAVAMALGQIG